MLNSFAEYPKVKAPYLESSKHMDHFLVPFIKFCIFQNISRCSINLLRPFKYKNICKLFETV